MNNREVKALHTRIIIDNLPRFFTRAEYDFMHDTCDPLGYTLDSATRNNLIYPCACELFDALDDDNYIIKRLRYYYTAAPSVLYIV